MRLKTDDGWMKGIRGGITQKKNASRGSLPESNCDLPSYLLTTRYFLD